jgi:hypothetical protein
MSIQLGLKYTLRSDISTGGTRAYATPQHNREIGNLGREMTRSNLCGLLTLMLAAPWSVFGADNILTPREKAQGWILLFDGKSLNGWDSASPPAPGSGRGQDSGAAKQGTASVQRGAAAAVGSNPRACSSVPSGASRWEVVDGLLVPCGEPAGYLTSNKDYKDFILVVDFRTGEDTNSGVFIRSPGGTGGYEVQIWKAQPQGYNTGSIVGAAKTDVDYKFIPDQWNHYEITADGDHLIVVLNGTKTLDIHDSKYPDGRIRLQYQKFPIEFKNIKLKLVNH